MNKIFTAFMILLAVAARADAEWSRLTSAPEQLYFDMAESGGVIYLASAGNGVYKSDNGAQSWQNLATGLSTREALAVNQLLPKGDTLYIATDDGIYKSTNDGANWIRKCDGIQPSNSARYLFTQSIFEHDGALYTGSWTGIHRSTDGGENWDMVESSMFGTSARYFIYHDGILFAARETNNSPYGYKSTDNGLSWDGIMNVRMPIITFLSEPGKLWAGTITGVRLSTNNGVTWLARNDGLSPDPYNSSFIRVNGTLVSCLKFGGSGVYNTTNDGILWEDFGQGLPFLSNAEKLILFGDKIFLATSDGIWQRDTSEVTTGIPAQSAGLPLSFELFQNYPNPFNAKSIIKYTIPQSSLVTITLYNILGNEIAVLANGPMAAGINRLEFGAGELSTGVYFYKIQAGPFGDTKKMILLK